MNRVNDGGAEFRPQPVRPLVVGGIRRFKSRLRKATCGGKSRLQILFLLLAASRSIFGAEGQSESPWDWSATLRSGVGYKDNVLLSDLFKESSIFTFNDAEAFLFRIPENGWEFTGVFTAED